MIEHATELTPARAKAVLEFENKIAAASWTKVDNRDATKTYNKYKLAQLQTLAPGFDFAELIKESGAQGVDNLIVHAPQRGRDVEVGHVTARRVKRIKFANPIG